MIKNYNYNLTDLINNLESTKQKHIRYINLGPKCVRLISYSKEFLPIIEKQLTYSLKEHSDNFDSTIIVWQEKVFDFIKEYDSRTNTYYYGVKDLDPEEFIKEGHVFVQIFNNILKTPSLNLVHGAVVGINNQGVLFCARGQRGKSTLAVLSMLKGFEYVSDDYLILEKEEDKLFSYPIYSIITLSPKMYNKLYHELDGCRFVSNNARKDKYVINIQNYHKKFKTKYPIKFCMFPQIVDDSKPSIEPCSAQDKGRAITHLIHSTINQMGDKHDINTVKKLMNMIEDFEFYKINLCPDIYKNVDCLKEFMANITNKEKINDKLCIK